MKSKILFWVFFCLSVNSLNAQKNDYIWLSGYGSEYWVDTNWYGTQFFQLGITKFDFNYEPFKMSHDSFKMYIDRTNVTFSSDEGEMLFYSNGVSVANRFHEYIENGDSLNWGFLLTPEWSSTMLRYGYRHSNAMQAIQKPGADSFFYLLHSFIDTFDGVTYKLSIIKNYLTEIDISANQGHGKVLYKDSALITGHFSVMGLCKHANGRDWWVLFQNKFTNCYSKLLITDSGVQRSVNFYCDGLFTDWTGLDAVTFSPNGEKFAIYESYTGLAIFDFDRCTGELSNPVYINNTITGDSNWIGMGAAISPNNRFLYICATNYVYQYDLWATDIAASEVIVAAYDGFAAPFGTYFFAAQLAPDGKIYISCGNSENYYHVINQPDEPGLACNLTQHGLRLRSLSTGVPAFPNYRLGALQNSPCDTLTGVEEEKRATREREIKVFPQPADEVVTVDYGFLNWEKGEAIMEIYSSKGVLVNKQPLPQYSGIQKLKIQHWSSGYYEVRIIRRDAVIGVQKLVVVHP